MTLQAIYPHGALLLPSPVAALVRLGELMATSAFWQTVAASTGRILGGFVLACLLGVVLLGAFFVVQAKGGSGRL